VRTAAIDFNVIVAVNYLELDIKNKAHSAANLVQHMGPLGLVQVKRIQRMFLEKKM
jgi:hypothetical protein